MSIFTLILKEIKFRKLNFILSLLAVITAVALFVAFMTTGDAYRKETRKIQLGMGQNLRIIPKETPMDDFWSIGYSKNTMPEEYVLRFAKLPGYEYTHLTATLQKKVQWQNLTVLLTGLLPEVMPPDKKQAPMTFLINRGEVYVGYDVAHTRGIKQGDRITLFGKSMTVARCLLPTGSMDDIRIHGHLHDIQEMLQLEGQINEIRALECLCLFESDDTDLDPLALAQSQLADILPEAKVLLLKGIADVRQQQRAAMEGYLSLILPIVLVACGVWIGILAMINVRDRRLEIGIMQALGHRPAKIAALFLGKSIIIGVIGALLGFAAGTLCAHYFGVGIFKITASTIKPMYHLLVWAVAGAAIFAAISSFIPAMSAMSQDPAITLRSK